MANRVYNVLFLCTHNSARSIMAEAVMNDLACGRFKAFSAGSSPSGKVNPLAIETLQKAGHDTQGLRSKSWNEFAAPGAPEMDIVITVCDNAAGEVCPIWPGHPVRVHFGLDDPSRVGGDDEAGRAAFSKTCQEITRRLREFVNLPIEKLDRNALQNKLNESGTE
ncbi:MAG: arsenate reductase ArsC [Nitrospiria bacterium]